jgi:hypothetical protein
MKRSIPTLLFVVSISLCNSGLFGQCDYKKNYFSDGKIESEGCMKNNRRDGTWKEYHKNGGVKFEWTYIEGMKQGPYKSYYESGKLNSIGNYKNGGLTDTLKFYGEDGKIFKVEVWEVSGKNQSTKIYSKHTDPKVRPDGTVQNINGKEYIWVDGQKIEKPK